MTTQDYRKITDQIHLELSSSLASLACESPFIATRLIDTDPDPEPGPYLDVTVCARIRVADFQLTHPPETQANPVDR